MKLRAPLLLSLIATAFFICASPPDLVAQSTRVVAIEDTPAPGGGTFDLLLYPVINDSGQVAFYASFGPNSEDDGLFLADRSGNVVRVVREGQQVPGGSETVTSTDSISSINGAGLISFRASFSNGSSRIYQGDGVAPLQEIVRTGVAAPDSNGVIDSFDAPFPNSAGQVAFTVALSGTSGGEDDDQGMVFYDPVGGLTQIVREGQATPDNVGTFDETTLFFVPSVNDSGRVAFQSGINSPTANDMGIFQWDGGAPVRIARVGDTAPASADTFTAFDHFPHLSDSGKTAFTASLSEAHSSGIFLGDGVSPLVEVVRTGQAAPDANGTFGTMRSPVVNDGNQVLFFSFVLNTSDSPNDVEGLFRGDGSGPPVQIARKGGALPDGNGTFNSFNYHTQNNAGQAAFQGFLNAPSNADGGIYFYDDSAGLLKVAREGDPFLGSTFSSVSLQAARYDAFPEREYHGISDDGEVAFRFSLADGRRGVAVWDFEGTTPPPPPTTGGSASDATGPVVTLKGRKKIKTSRRRVVVKGFAADPSGVALVEFRPGKGRFKPAKLLGGGLWKAVVKPSRTKKKTVVQIRAYDTASNPSGILKAKVVRTR